MNVVKVGVEIQIKPEPQSTVGKMMAVAYVAGVEGEGEEKKRAREEGERDGRGR